MVDPSRHITAWPPPCMGNNMFESRLDPFVRRHEKLKGPKGLSQKVRDMTVIHNQASLRPCMWQRGITPVLSTGVNAQCYIQKQGTQLYSYWNCQNSYQTIAFRYFSSTFITIPVSVHVFRSLSSASSGWCTQQQAPWQESQVSCSWSGSLPTVCRCQSIRSHLLLGGTSRMSSQHWSTEPVAVRKAQYPSACPAPYVQLHMTSDRSGSGNLWNTNATSHADSVHTLPWLFSNGQSVHKAKLEVCIQTLFIPAEHMPLPAVWLDKLASGSTIQTQSGEIWWNLCSPDFTSMRDVM